MKELLILVAMVVLFVLSGCSLSPSSLPQDTHSENNKEIQISTEEESCEEFSSQTSVIGAEQKPIPTENVSVQEKAEESTTTITYPTEKIKELEPETNVIQSELPKEEIAIPDNSVPQPTEASSEPQMTIDSESDSQTEPMDETEPIPESKPQQQEEIKSFDVTVYVEYAKNYSVEKGLKLDSAAVSCWDDPIRANADSVYLERDIRDRLDWYCMSGFTAVWVWTEDLGNCQYDIYIGYA